MTATRIDPGVTARLGEPSSERSESVRDRGAGRDDADVVLGERTPIREPDERHG
jgi:hypothetical protein